MQDDQAYFQNESSNEFVDDDNSFVESTSPMNESDETEEKTVKLLPTNTPIDDQGGDIFVAVGEDFVLNVSILK